MCYTEYRQKAKQTIGTTKIPEKQSALLFCLQKRLRKEENMEEKEIMEIISKLSWKFAKSMPQIPHWYTVRQKDDPELNEMYVKLYNYIRDNHYVKLFKKRPYKYCDIGDYMYWAMTNDINESIIINRAEIKKE